MCKREFHLFRLLTFVHSIIATQPIDPYDGSNSDFDSGSSSESDDESGSELESSAGSVAPSDGSPDLPSRENLSVVQGAQASQGQGSQKPRTVPPSKGDQTIEEPTSNNSTETMQQVSQNKKPKKPLKSLKDFLLDPIFFKWYRDDNDNIFRKMLAELGLKDDKGDIERLVKLLCIVAEIICELFRGEKEFNKNLHYHYNKYFGNNSDDGKQTIEKFDNYLYCWAIKNWPRALDRIHESCRR